MNVSELMSDVAEIQQQHKGQKPERVSTCSKWEGIQQNH
jgi:hypothetical protein